MLEKITDFQDPALDIFARLSEKELLNRACPEDGIFIAESPKVIERALDSGCEPVSILLEEKHVEGEGAAILRRCPGVPAYAAPFDVLTKLTGFKLTRGMLCAMRRPVQPTALEICKKANRVAILEDVVNPTNVGAIFRSAAALGMDALLLTPACSDPLYRRAIRVSMGNVFLIPWAYIEKEDWPEACMDQMHQLGYRILAMALSDESVSIDDPILKEEERLAVLLGTEGDGLKSSTIQACDYTVKIPMAEDVDSLNVAAASAVAFWELRKP